MSLNIFFPFKLLFKLIFTRKLDSVKSFGSVQNPIHHVKGTVAMFLLPLFVIKNFIFFVSSLIRFLTVKISSS